MNEKQYLGAGLGRSNASSLNAVPLQCEQVAPSPISAAFAQLEGEVNVLSDLIASLHDKITPILLQDPDKPEPVKDVSKSYVPLVARMEETIQRLNRINTSVREMRNQVSL